MLAVRRHVTCTANGLERCGVCIASRVRLVIFGGWQLFISVGAPGQHGLFAGALFGMRSGESRDP